MTDYLDRARRGRRRRAHPDPRRRPGRAAARRDGTAAVRLHRPGDDRRGRVRARRCAPCLSCSTSPTRVREPAAPGAWIVDFTNPVGIVTRALLDDGHRAIGLCNVAIGLQRRCARAARRRAGAARRRPGRAQPPDLGARGAARRRATCCPSCSPTTASELAEQLGLPARAARRARRAAVLLPALLLRPRRGARRAAVGRRAARRGRRRDRARAAGAVSGPDARRRSRHCSSSAAARSTARRRRGLLASLAAATATSTSSTYATTATIAGLADDDVVEVPARIDARRCRTRCPSAPLAPELLGLVQHVAAYERLAVDRRTDARTASTRARRCSPTHSSASGSMVDELLEGCSTSRAAERGDRAMSTVLAVDGGNSKTDLALVDTDGALLAAVRGPGSSPHHVGLAAALRRARGALRRGDGGCRAARPSSRSPRSAHSCWPASTSPREEERAAGRALERARWAARTSVRNDTFAVLRAGTERGWGVAVVCGAGHQLRGCRARTVATRDSPRSVRSPVTGAAATTSGSRRWRPPRAARTGAGRGRRSSARVPAHFGLDDAAASSPRRSTPVGSRRGGVLELAPLVLRRGRSATPWPPRSSTGWPPRSSRSPAWRLTRLGAGREPVEVVLGGGLLRAANGRSWPPIEAGLAGRGAGDHRARRARRRRSSGAALLGLDDLGRTGRRRPDCDASWRGGGRPKLANGRSSDG